MFMSCNRCASNILKSSIVCRDIKKVGNHCSRASQNRFYALVQCILKTFKLTSGTDISVAKEKPAFLSLPTHSQDITK